ncbi:putative patatin/cPLA2 family phospholipase [Evansella vedderi]|uniref:Patatin/cPLA2 family phospholipase n=2 Tax=Evansella vedderi TaxID=38282 RepID=A0ABT9ZW49_9BACI|nr:putative patatin/cPLA2 family phospholipase [Evansella vedderi]
MKGLYTAGVLEFFLEQNLFFPYVIGVSAGACMAGSYLSKQKGRNKRVNIGLVKDPRYLSYRNILLKRQLFGMDFLFDEIPNKIIPFDFETFLAGEEKFYIGTTDCHSGEAVYYNKHEIGFDTLKVIRASSSLPFIAPIVDFKGKKLLDGGLVDPIPLKKAQQDGHKKNVIIMTNSPGFTDKPNKLNYLAKVVYNKYPKIATILRKRHMIYNDTLAYIKTEEEKGNLFIIQPSIPLPMSPIERNEKRLLDLYHLGYNDAKNQWGSLIRWLNQ